MSPVKWERWSFPTACAAGTLYQNLVDATLRYVIERVGGVEGVYDTQAALPDHFLARRTAGNAIEVLGIVAFRASPVWILAALADLCGMGRHLIPEIADALEAQGLLEPGSRFTSVDQLLDGLERTSSRLAATVNTPPLDVAALRQEWTSLREDARGLRAGLPAQETVSQAWAQLKAESMRQNTSIFETSSVMAVSAVRAVPEAVRWLSASTRVGATRGSRVIAAALLDHYAETLQEIRAIGYLTSRAPAGPPVPAGCRRAVLPLPPDDDGSSAGEDAALLVPAQTVGIPPRGLEGDAPRWFGG